MGEIGQLKSKLLEREAELDLRERAVEANLCKLEQKKSELEAWEMQLLRYQGYVDDKKEKVTVAERQILEVLNPFAETATRPPEIAIKSPMSDPGGVAYEKRKHFDSPSS